MARNPVPRQVAILAQVFGILASAFALDGRALGLVQGGGVAMIERRVVVELEAHFTPLGAGRVLRRKARSA